MQASTQKCRQTDRKQKQHTHTRIHFQLAANKKAKHFGCVRGWMCVHMCVCITSSFYYICFQEFSNMPKQLQPQCAYPLPPSSFLSTAPPRHDTPRSTWVGYVRHLLFVYLHIQRVFHCIFIVSFLCAHKSCHTHTHTCTYMHTYIVYAIACRPLLTPQLTPDWLTLSVRRVLHIIHINLKVNM